MQAKCRTRGALGPTLDAGAPAEWRPFPQRTGWEGGRHVIAKLRQLLNYEMTVAEWIALAVLLGIPFAVLGAYIGLMAGFPLLALGLATS